MTKGKVSLKEKQIQTNSDIEESFDLKKSSNDQIVQPSNSEEKSNDSENQAENAREELQDKIKELKNRETEIIKRIENFIKRFNHEELSEKCYPWENLKDRASELIEIYKNDRKKFVEELEEKNEYLNNLETEIIAQDVIYLDEILKNLEILVENAEEKLFNLKIKLMSDLEIERKKYPKGNPLRDSRVTAIYKSLDLLKYSLKDIDPEIKSSFSKIIISMEDTLAALEADTISLKKNPRFEDIEANDNHFLKLMEKLEKTYKSKKTFLDAEKLNYSAERVASIKR